MADYSPHVKILTFFLILVLTYFIMAFTFNIENLWRSLIIVIAVIVLVITVLARFGGNLGGTD
ncbi:MAG: hypothetical protein HY556_02075 [Euryarchaeota archaeon]|nr:hypothetical protein [Euryarchaeota archaeon]